ncbi:MAG: hypothetical protein JWQ44_391 [Chthoniobacter sp.]|nr:hypothetical protein [Chthoniobacter sp.]
MIIALPRVNAKHLLAALLPCFLFLARAFGDPGALLDRDAAIGRIEAATGRLNALYWSPTLNIWLDQPGDDLRAHYEGRLNPPWWPSANAVEVLLDYMTATGTAGYEATIEALYATQKDQSTRRARVVAELKRRNQWSEADEEKWQRRSQRKADAAGPRSRYYNDFENEYLDDSGWWGITWLKMHDRTGAPKYLTTATTIHAHMARNWRPDKGGGVLWCEDEDKQRPNAITNSLFLILSARLHQRTGEQSYLDWADKTLQWFRTNALYDGTGIIDAPGHQADHWSYNQGTFIGGLAALYETTGRKDYLDEAVKVTQGVLQRSGLALPTGVLVEKLGTEGDACLFKGVFVRYLAQLRDVLRAQKLHPTALQEIDRCIHSSVGSMLQHSLGADGLFTAEWHEGAKDKRSNFNTQVSALAALVAMLPDTKAESPASAKVPETDLYGKRTRAVTAAIQNGLLE